MNKKIYGSAMSTVLALSLLAGCSGTDDNPTTAAPTTQPAETTTVAEETTKAAEVETTAPDNTAEIPQDYKYYFSFDEADERVHYASQDMSATPIVQATNDEITYVTGVKGNAIYLDGTKGAKLDVNGVGSTYTVSFWVNPLRSAQYMPTLQYGPDIHGDVTGGQHYVNFTWAKWDPEDTSVLEYPCVWAYDQNDDAKWPNWYPGGLDDRVKEWTNITMTVDENELSADGTLVIAHLYINGEEFIPTDSDGNERPVQIVFNTMAASDNYDFLLGVNYWDAIFKGAFDEIYIYDYAVDADVAKALYEAGDASAKYEEPEYIVEIVEDANAIDTLGTPDLDLAFWSEFTETVEIKDGDSKVIKFNNYSDGVNSYDNYVMVFTNQAHAADVDPNSVEGNKEFAAVRADAYGWLDGNGENVIPESSFTYTWGNWSKWAQLMRDAEVTLTVSREGNIIKINASNIDYNNAEQLMTATIETSMADSDSCFLTLTGEKCYVELLSVGDALKIEPDSNAIDHLGSVGDNGAPVLGWWSDWTGAYEIADGETKTVTLRNYSSGAENWHNFVTVFANTNIEGHKAPADQSTDYYEYCVLRADAYGWGSEDNAHYSPEFTTSWTDWSAWLAAMKKADVTININRSGSVLTLDYVFAGYDGVEYTETAKVTCDVIDASKPVYFFFTGESAYIELLSVE
ncbi:MAG: hypothetical protein K6F92_05295 [Lachnospiraceae bacterium]|nr:hypothetical protein [Lachnospiraceae bacterium]